MHRVNTDAKTQCYHCGEECLEDNVKFDAKDFCCPGCKLVYEVLSENNLCNYYQFLHHVVDTCYLLQKPTRPVTT